MKVAVLSGGIGGARFLRGLLGVVDPTDVSIVGNVGDDTEVLGLHISPDLDSVLYTLTGLADEERGWGRADETWNALDTVTRLGGESWFRLGDRDIGLHLVRTQWLREGVPMSEATERIAHALGLEVALLPATDDPLRTFLETPAGTFPFQTWFVARGHKDEVDAVHYAGAPEARRRAGVLEALRAADVIVIAPSNPYVSIGPILAVDEIRSALEQRTAPASRSARSSAGARSRARPTGCSRRLAGGTTPEHVARCYEGLIDVLVVDESDAPSAPVPGLRSTVVTQTLMTDVSAARRLAAATVHARRARRREDRDPRRHRQLRPRARGRLAALAQDDVVLGSRDAERARLAAEELGGGRLSGATNVDAVRGADLVVLAVKADAALDTAPEVAEALDVTPLLCVATRDRVSQGSRRAARSRGAQPCRARAGPVRAPVAAGLHSIAAANLDEEAPDEDALICGDDARAKELSLELAGRLVAGRALDAGPLASARALEGLTAVIVNLNRRYKAHAGLRVTGVPDQA